MEDVLTTRSSRAYPCPVCERTNDAASPAGRTPADATPEAGDVSLCFGCASWLVFTGRETETRRATPAEIADLESETTHRELRRLLLRFLKTHPA